ncbi:5-(carboxyamino)imidazole ribonucleotide synthase [Halocalculus aciditolerans]|uniref:N5-carboxyaminoimidazole ribonucleotide synthase n=1 Tax=Halocalculus aciditolerans TaxID=1383812 RepID=A0A830FCB2_9EURY|nr:5-(carboxyamino)imidazole ribonucleotide synthase [Halocalculus aciditolerans]GGL61249.1 5-(carboxyamino)imidazole ribonucleotide synthase [Halocalculus aciditolerans]
MTVLVPDATLGVVGGGQLGRMLAEAASPLGVDVVVLDPTPDCPAAPPAAAQIQGDFDDPEALDELAARSDALTFEIELADPDVLAEVSDTHDVPVHPDPDTLRTIQDKYVQDSHFADAGVPGPAFRQVDDADDLEAAFEELGSPLMLKARTGGYDGRGNAPAETVEDAEEYFGGLEGLVAEAFVDFERELSIIGVVGDGERAAYPVVENIHEAEILRETVAPARTTDAVAERARDVAMDVLDALDGRGVYGIELFETSEGEVLVNEVAPRPHNSGHYTIEAGHASQFEQHARAVLGLPLAPTALRDAAVSANILGTVDETRPAKLTGVRDVLAEPGVHLHWYGKDDVRPLRKMGHLTLVGSGPSVEPDHTDGENREEMLSRARAARDALDFD